MYGSDFVPVFALSLFAELPFLDVGDNSGEGCTCALQCVDANLQFCVLLNGGRWERAGVDFSVPFQGKSLSAVGVCLRNYNELLTGQRITLFLPCAERNNIRFARIVNRGKLVRLQVIYGLCPETGSYDSGLALSISSVSSPSWGIRTNFILANRCLYSSFTVFSLLGTFPMRAVMKLDKL